MISELRQDGCQTGTKSLLIIDQFEQWLHAHPDPENTVLAKALRQCDDQYVQCILMVRDDFWMGITEFARILDVRLIEGHNSQAVDCFRPSHAKKVLTEFGRAYGDLPESSKPLSTSQEQFLDLTIDQLADDGKVVCIRLALFAQMMQGKPWTPIELEKVGGAAGIGVAFLEETFNSSSAPAPFRYHEKAARRVLKTLLPDIGLQIKGQEVPRDELFEQSGYQKHPERFNELMQSLDAQVRLVTPSDSTMNDEIEISDTSSELSYQLTHDYLVPSIREWLSRKQKETWQGRAELCLEDRASQFQRSTEIRYLPSPLEYLAIQAAVPGRIRSVGQQRVMRAATKRYGLLAISFVILACISCLGLWELNGRVQARRIVDAIMVADSGALSSQIDELDSYRRWARVRLGKMSAEHGIDPKLRLRASLALVPEDPGQIPYLRSQLTNCSAEEFPVILETLRRHMPSFRKDVWAEFENRALSPRRRFQAGVALAAYAPDSERWKDADLEFLFERISAPDSEDQRKLIPQLAPISDHLVPFLDQAFRGAESEVTRVSAANALISLGIGDARLLAELSSVATSAQYNVLFPRLSSMWNDDNRVREAFVAIVQQQPTSGMNEQERVKLGRRRASAAISLINLGEPESAFALFTFQDDPEAMTQFVHRVKDRRLTVEHVVDLLERAKQNKHERSRFALLLTLGEFAIADLPDGLKEPLTAQLVNDYETEPSSAIHSATGWLLRQWGLQDEVRRVDHTPVSYDDSGDREWYVEQIGSDYFTFVVFQPAEFVMGSPESERSRNEYERQHRVKLTRTIAVSDREITRGQFLRHVSPHRNLLVSIEDYSPTDDHAIGFLSWNYAVEFCRELTRHVDGAPEGDDCYDGRMTLSTDEIAFHPERKGIRLPTESEWEFICRSGAQTTYGFGSDRSLLEKYAWFILNEGEGSRVGGELRPNLRGLFDMHGNAFEWCHDWFAKKVVDEQNPQGAEEGNTRSIRGGGWKGRFLTCRSANRMQDRPAKGADGRGNSDYGFRIVRTLDAGRHAN